MQSPLSSPVCGPLLQWSQQQKFACSHSRVITRIHNPLSFLCVHTRTHTSLLNHGRARMQTHSFSCVHTHSHAGVLNHGRAGMLARERTHSFSCVHTHSHAGVPNHGCAWADFYLVLLIFSYRLIDSHFAPLPRHVETLRSFRLIFRHSAPF